MTTCTPAISAAAAMAVATPGDAAASLMVTAVVSAVPVTVTAPCATVDRAVAV